MKNMVTNLANSTPTRTTFKVKRNPKRLLPGPSTQFSEAERSPTSKQIKVDSVFDKINMLRKTVKGKLTTIGAKILQVVGVDKVFRRIFSVPREEQLLKASKCCLSTTAGPIEGLLFISTDRLAFCSDEPILKFISPRGESLRFHYKVMIPLGKIKRVSQSKHMKRPSQKYLQVVTTDDFEFWFMGFQRYKKTFHCLQHAISKA